MIANKYPKITCVMVTNGRLDCIKHSVQCYINQSYCNKDLVILSQANEEINEEIISYINKLFRPDIRFFIAPQDLSLGMMRNTSIELSTGEIICQWDDDDLYHHDRILTQYNSLRSNNHHVASCYCDFLKYFKNTQEIYWCDWSKEPIPSHRYLCGTIMFYKKYFGEFPIFYPEHGHQSKCEEDLNVLEKLMTKGTIGSVFSGHQYIYVYHGKNTYGLDHHILGINTTWGKKLYSQEELLLHCNLIEETFKSVNLNDTVKVVSPDGLAFTYDSNTITINILEEIL